MLSTGDDGAARQDLRQPDGGCAADQRQAATARGADRARSPPAWPRPTPPPCWPPARGETKTAIVAALAGVSPAEARARLADAGGVVRRALEQGSHERPAGRRRGSPPAPLYLGIDGGGTQVRAVLVDGAGHERGRGLAGSANPAAVGRDQAAAHIRLAVEQAARPGRGRSAGGGGLLRPGRGGPPRRPRHDAAPAAPPGRPRLLENDAELALEATARPQRRLPDRRDRQHRAGPRSPRATPPAVAAGAILSATKAAATTSGGGRSRPSCAPPMGAARPRACSLPSWPPGTWRARRTDGPGLSPAQHRRSGRGGPAGL